MKLQMTLCLQIQAAQATPQATQIAALLQQLAQALPLPTTGLGPGLLVKSGLNQLLLVSMEASV